MGPGSFALPRTILVFDVESFGDRNRTDHHRIAVREGLFSLLKAVLTDLEVAPDSVHAEDRGDGALVLLSADVPKILLVDRLPAAVDAELRRHNADHSAAARMRLRIAVHAGEVRMDPYGAVGTAVNFAFRILDAREAKRALAASEATSVLIVSDWFYQAVVTQDPAARPETFRPVPVDVKETQDKAWIRLVGDQPMGVVRRPVVRRDLTLGELAEIVDVLLQIPVLETREGRDQVLRELGPDVWSTVQRHSSAKSDLVSIVRHCLRHGDAWDRLVAAIRFFAGGFDAMTQLDATQARLELEGDQ